VQSDCLQLRAKVVEFFFVKYYDRIVSDYIFISLIQSLANKSGTSANKKLFSSENDEQKSRGEKIVLAVRAFGKLPTA